MIDPPLESSSNFRGEHYEWDHFHFSLQYVWHVNLGTVHYFMRLGQVNMTQFHMVYLRAPPYATLHPCTFSLVFSFIFYSVKHLGVYNVYGLRW